MNLKNKFLLGAIATVGTGIFAAPAFSALTYDLRFADGTKVKDAAVGNYTVNLYAIIDQGTGGFADDSITGGLLNIYSSSTGGGAMNAGSGVTARVAPGTGALTTPNLSLATTADASGDLLRSTVPNTAGTGDGILDWGADERYITSGGGATAANPLLSNYFVNGASVAATTRSYNWRFTQPFVPGTAIPGGISQASTVRPNSWEVLIGQFTINVNGVGGTGTTSFTPFSWHRNRASSTAPSAAGGSNYVQDGALGTTLPGGVNVPYADGSFSGVTFNGVIPEPSTIVLCGLAAIASVYGLRRRLTA
ncbi:MAG: PEP-CTERM sorting domain-containing protein [Pirellulales bacterium]|nr:PEP-CTERM sorting domain-containing protein [Pirellulales bacterium]